MIVEEFSVKGEERLEELRVFLLSNMPSASFRHSPVCNNGLNDYEVSLRYSIEDALKLEDLRIKWEKQDQSEVIKIMPTKSLFHQFFAIFKTSSS